MQLKSRTEIFPNIHVFGKWGNASVGKLVPFYLFYVPIVFIRQALSKMPAHTGAKRFRSDSLSTKEMKCHCEEVSGQQAMTSVCGEVGKYNGVSLHVRAVCLHVLRSVLNRPASTLSASYGQVQSATRLTSPKII